MLTSRSSLPTNSSAGITPNSFSLRDIVLGPTEGGSADDADHRLVFQGPTATGHHAVLNRDNLSFNSAATSVSSWA